MILFDFSFSLFSLVILSRINYVQASGNAGEMIRKQPKRVEIPPRGATASNLYCKLTMQCNCCFSLVHLFASTLYITACPHLHSFPKPKKNAIARIKTLCMSHSNYHLHALQPRRHIYSKNDLRVDISL